MEVIQHRQPQSLQELHDVYVRRTLDGNKMRVERGSNKTCNEAPRRERKRGVKIVSKSRVHTSWWTNREMRRKRRVVKYKLYAAEGKLKSSMEKGFRSLRNTCTKIMTRINI